MNNRRLSEVRILEVQVLEIVSGVVGNFGIDSGSMEDGGETSD